MPTGPKGEKRPAVVIGNGNETKPPKDKAAALGRKGGPARV